jgi:carboxypeptidase PM20D1
VLLSVKASGGHSSMPPARGESAIGILSAALAKIDAQPMPGSISGVAQDMFDTVAPEMSGINRVVLSNRWLFGPLLTRMLERAPGTNAILRTTTALTLVHSGNKENVLPGHAEATVNFRLLPGDTAQTVLAHVRKVIDDGRVELKVAPGGFDASPVSSSESAAYKQIAEAVRAVFPNTVAAPALMLGATDGRHFAGIADNVYRFSPIRAGPQDLQRFHGTNERLSVANLAEMIRFYHRLVQQAAQ